MYHEKNTLFRDKEFYRKLWNLALPIALQSLMLALVAATDALMLVHYRKGKWIRDLTR